MKEDQKIIVISISSLHSKLQQNHMLETYLHELNCCPAGGGLVDPPPPPKALPLDPKAGDEPAIEPNAGAEDEAIDPKVGAFDEDPNADGAALEDPNVAPPPNAEAPPKPAGDPKAGAEPSAGGEPKAGAAPNPEGLVGVF